MLIELGVAKEAERFPINTTLNYQVNTLPDQSLYPLLKNSWFAFYYQRGTCVWLVIRIIIFINHFSFHACTVKTLTYPGYKEKKTQCNKSYIMYQNNQDLHDNVTNQKLILIMCIAVQAWIMAHNRLSMLSVNVQVSCGITSYSSSSAVLNTLSEFTSRGTWMYLPSLSQSCPITKL